MGSVPKRALLAFLISVLGTSVATAAPVLAPTALPDFSGDIVGPTLTLRWAPATPSTGNPQPVQYEVEVSDLSVSQTSGKTVATTSLTLNLTDGHNYGFRVRAWQPVPSGGQFDREYSVFTELIDAWVDGTPPVPVVRVSSPRVDLGTEVGASAEGSQDGPGGPSTSGLEPEQAFSWDWGDGTPAVQGLEASHLYAKPGLFKGVLTVRDQAGNATFAPFAVTVLAPAKAASVSNAPLTRLRVVGRVVAGHRGRFEVQALERGPLRRPGPRRAADRTRR